MLRLLLARAVCARGAGLAEQSGGVAEVRRGGRDGRGGGRGGGLRRLLGAHGAGEGDGGERGGQEGVRGELHAFRASRGHERVCEGRAGRSSETVHAARVGTSFRDRRGSRASVSELQGVARAERVLAAADPVVVRVGLEGAGEGLRGVARGGRGACDEVAGPREGRGGAVSEGGVAEDGVGAAPAEARPEADADAEVRAAVPQDGVRAAVRAAPTVTVTLSGSPGSVARSRKPPMKASRPSSPVLTFTMRPAADPLRVGAQEASSSTARSGR